jgi:predicted DsbA family dithiol-disulfide isomerase
MPEHASPRSLLVEVWSDIACPWCWLGKHHLEAAIRGLGEPVEVEFRSFELQPQAGASRPVNEYLAERFGDARAVDAAHERLALMGRAVGIEYDFERALMSNTFDAHRVHHLAQARGVGPAVLERLMMARQGEGADVADHATLVRLAVEAGLDRAEVEQVLASEAYAAEVRADEAKAATYGIRGVPFFVFDGQLAVSGAQPVAVFEGALREAAVHATSPD